MEDKEIALQLTLKFVDKVVTNLRLTEAMFDDITPDKLWKIYQTLYKAVKEAP